MKCVFRELKGYVVELILIVLTVIGTTLCTLGMPLLLTRLIDKAIPNGNKAGIFAIVGVMLLLVVIGLLCGIATSFLSSKLL